MSIQEILDIINNQYNKIKITKNISSHIHPSKIEGSRNTIWIIFQDDTVKGKTINWDSTTIFPSVPELIYRGAPKEVEFMLNGKAIYFVLKTGRLETVSLDQTKFIFWYNQMHDKNKIAIIAVTPGTRAVDPNPVSDPITIKISNEEVPIRVFSLYYDMMTKSLNDNDNDYQSLSNFILQ